MSRYPTIRMVVAGAALALGGCAVTAPDRGVQPPEAGAQTVFEATGLAYLGEDTPLSQASKHAYHESKRRLFDAGATIHLSSVQATAFGELTTDCAMQVVGGTLLDFEVLNEGIEPGKARYFVRSRARFEKRGAEKALEKEALQKIGCWSDEPEPPGGPPARDATKVVTDGGSAPAKPDSRTSSRSGTPVVVVAVPAAEATVCCHGFPDELSRQVFPLLARTQGVAGLQRLTTTDASLCYRFRYDGPLAPLEQRLEEEIRTSAVLAFRIRRDRGPRIIDLVYDGGFD